ncbi:polysaccharide biosynthesis/export family protein [Crateriforma spongiae]|uniref:polysaccharide biosynthesis/export family protein n=1 Tax=Crateriforma spongiae TaxID=2724528 RepID=UPI00144529F2|nr:polysaccharide biosynthesis/export family protein [Crateriforma spongiae]
MIHPRSLTESAAVWILVTLTLFSTGCQFHWNNWDGESIPANRLSPDLFGCSRDDLVPVPQTKLGQNPVDQHRIGAGDVLSVYIFGVFPPGENETPIVEQNQGLNQRYYPPNGNVVAPSTGLPIKVQSGGTLDLPLIQPLAVQGLTLTEATETIRAAYYKQNVLLQGQGQITVGLLIPRTQRVVVLREDSPAGNMTLSGQSAVVQAHRGSGQVIDLPIYENDVLHALAATGGLPGTDAAREVYVIRAGGFADRLLDSTNPNALVNDYVERPSLGGQSGTLEIMPDIVRIPLMIRNATLPFGPNDVILNEGDVLFVPKRREYFYTGGLLPGGRVPLPRDEDLDIVEAIAMVGASPGGPMGQDGAVLMSGRQAYLRSATRAVILRKLPDGRQMNIRVDLDRAMHDPKERIDIQPDDVVMLYQKPGAAIINSALGVAVR